MMVMETIQEIIRETAQKAESIVRSITIIKELVAIE